MPTTIIYIHGQYGSPDEAEHYRPLFPGCEVIGFDYKAQTPWDAEREFAKYFGKLAGRGRGSIVIVANSIGAFYAMCALSGMDIAAAYFISPIVDMERIEGVTLDVMPGGVHWFHTPEQMAFLDEWISRHNPSLANSAVSR